MFRKLFPRRLKKPVDILMDAMTVFSVQLNELHVLKTDGFVSISERCEKSQTIYELVFQRKKDILSILRTKEKNVVEDTFETLKAIVNVVFREQPSISKEASAQILREIVSLTNTIKNDNWTVAHVVAFLGLPTLFTAAEVIPAINKQSSNEKITPLQIAIQKKNVPVIKAIMNHNAKLDIQDSNGNNAMHYAIISLKEIAIMVCKDTRYRKALSRRNNINCTPCHLACFAEKTDNLKELLRLGLTAKYVSLESNVEVNAINNGDVAFNSSLIEALDSEDMKYGGTPLHWVKSRVALEKILTIGYNINATNLNGETALHVMVRKERLECVVVLLCYGISTDTRAIREETALHYAVRMADLATVQALLVFDAKLDDLNEKGDSARHIASSSRDFDSEMILYALHSLGASRCNDDKRGCPDGCAHNGSFNGAVSHNEFADPFENWYKDYIQSNFLKTCVEELKNDENKNYVRLICFDGGGIRGLLTIQTLIELEKRLKYPFQCYFNWFAGTSTGSMIASLLCLDVPLPVIRALYLTIKEKVIHGSKPYNAQKLEVILKQYLGENTVMSDIKHAKLTITATLGDRKPAQLYLFRNYPSPREILSLNNQQQPLFCGNEYTTQKLWEACRGSGAAPTYFKAHGPFIDGGLIANNPTLDLLTEYTHYNDIRNSLGKEEEIEELQLVVSIGAGRLPTFPQ
ncbi:85/88 kDa calcium-independent phospholipase A2-like protein, partial [Leptotrombidium deliense]